MRRRQFISLVGGVAGSSLLSPLPSFAEPIPVIGFLSGRSVGKSGDLVAAFANGLREQGFIQSQNVAIESEWADGRYDRLSEQAADLVRRRVALIVAVGAVQAIRAAKAATSTIPIVFVTGDDPVRMGLVATLNRPGGNITGVSPMNQDLEAKRLAILHELVPKAAAIGYLSNPKGSSAELQEKQVEAAARALGRQLYVLKATSDSEISVSFATLEQQKVGGLLMAADPQYNSRRDLLVALAAQYKIPTLFHTRDIPQAGGLMSYGPNLSDSYRQAGVYVGRILKGEKPGEIPVTRAVKFDLVINMKTAKALGLDIPDRLLALSDDVIE